MKRNILSIMLILSGMICSAQSDLIPLPKRVENLRGNFIFSNKTTLIFADKSLEKEALLLKKLLQPAMGFDFQLQQKSNSIIVLNKENSTNKIKPEAYQLLVNPDKIEISAADSSGFFYAFQTLLQLLPAEIYGTEKVNQKVWKIDAIKINDQPLYSWRGAMLDVSRQFYEISYLKKYINWMAAHKLNVFHLHLSDDEGWRIEIKAYPKLTEIGAWRGPNEALPPAHGSGDKRYGGFYTQDELKELVKYAAERNVQILPEIDIPGHSKSVAVAYPEILCNSNDTSQSVQGVKHNVWCAGRDRNFEMLDTIIGEVAAIFPMKYIHIGGDEVNFKVWDHCSLCRDLMTKNAYSKPAQLQNYFISRIDKIIEKHGKLMMGWNEILEDSTLGKTTAVMVWTSVNAINEAVQKQHPVIITPSSYFYIAMTQGIGERGHEWATFLPAERLYSFQLPTDSLSKIYVKGIQANLWAEYLDQPDFQTDYQSYPRLCALAELAWSGNKSSFQNFEKRLNQSHYDRLYSMGIHFRVPSPTVKLVDGKLKFKNTLKQSMVVFTTDSTLPTANSTELHCGTNVHNRTNNPNNLLFRTSYKNSLLSPAVSLAYDTVGIWNKDVLCKEKSNILDFTLLVGCPNSTKAHSLLFKYKYGSEELFIKQITIYNDTKVVFEKINDKPIGLFSHTPEWEVSLPESTLLRKGKYRIKVELSGYKPTDSYGVILLK